MHARLAAAVGALAMGAVRTTTLLTVIVFMGQTIVQAQTAAANEKLQLVPQLGIAAISSVAFSADGRFVLTGSGGLLAPSDEARLWDAATGKQIRSFRGHAARVESVSFSPDGRFVLTGSDDGTAGLWDASRGRQIRSFAGHTESVWSVAFSPDGRFVLTGSQDNTARLWDASTGQQIRSFEGHTGYVHSVAFSQDGRFVLTGSQDSTARLWDAATGRQIRSFEGHTSGVFSVAFSPDGRFVLTGSQDNTARLWDASTGQQIRSFGGDTGWIHSVAFSPDSRFVLIGSDSTARLWDADTGEQIRSFEGHTDEVFSVAFSPDGHRVLTGSKDNTVRLWDASAGQQIGSLEGHTSHVILVAFSPDGRSMFTKIDDKTVRLWDTATGQQTRSFEGGKWPFPVAFSLDGRSMLTGSNDNTARLLDTRTGQQIRSFKGHTDAVTSLAFSPDGGSVLTGSNDGTARLWDVATGRQIRSFGQDTGSVTSVAFSPDSSFVLVGSDNTARLWDRATGKQTRSFEVKEGVVDFVAFSPDARLVLTLGADATVQLWDASSGQNLRSLKGYEHSVASVAFSPDGQTLLTGGGDHTARLWDAATGQQIRSFEGHENTVSSVAFSADGRYLLTGSDDTTTRLWDAASGKQLGTLLNFENDGWAVVDSEGRFDTSDLDGGVPLVWVASSEPMRALPLEIFMRDYYTPRLLSRILHGEKLPEVRSIAEIKNRVQPEVSIVSVIPSKTNPGRVDVVVHGASSVEEKKDAKGELVKDAGGKVETQASGLQDLRLFRNGQLVANTELNKALADGNFAFDDVQLPAAVKTVTFTAYAFNSERIKSSTVEKDYGYEPGAARKPRAWLLQVGVNHYEATGCELHGSVNDAEVLGRVLEQKLKDRGLDVQQPVLLVSDGTREGATKEGIRQALAKIAAQAAPDDVFFLSFSGHGYGDNAGQFYIFPADVQGSCRDVNGTLLAKAISSDDLAEWLRPIDAGEMTFVLDSCQSASSVEANDFKPGPMGSGGLGQLAYDKRMRILAASQGNQEAQETNLVASEGAGAASMRGLLSYALTDEGLLQGKADWKPVDGKITVGEWLTYAAYAVPKLLEAGRLKGGRGLGFVSPPVGFVGASQMPAVFDFSKQDGFVLMEGKAPAKPYAIATPTGHSSIPKPK